MNNKLFCLLGPSGSGKTTLGERMKKYLNFQEVVSHTIRDKREGEKEGVTYYYVDNFDGLNMVEEVEYSGNKYGFSEDEINKKLNNHNRVFCIAECNGIEQLKELYDVVVIYIYSTYKECYFRLLERDGRKETHKRMAHAIRKEEFDNFDIVDYVLRSKDSEFGKMLVQMKSIVNHELGGKYVLQR